MLTLDCGVTDCKVQVVDTDKDVAIARFKAHMLTHTSYAGRDTDKSVSVARPRITQGMSMEEWKSFQALWRLFKIETDLSEEECSLQLILCCEEKLVDQVHRADPSMPARPEVGWLEAI